MEPEQRFTGSRACWLKVLGCAGVAFLALAASADNLVAYLFGPGYFWIIGGTYVAGCWAYEMYCRGQDDK